MFKPVKDIKDLNIKYDVDSIAILSTDLQFYKVLTFFEIPLFEEYARPMENVKIFRALEEKLGSKNVDEGVNLYYDFLLGGVGLPLYVCLKLTASFKKIVKEEKMKLRAIFINCAKEAVKKLKISTKTRKYGAELGVSGELSYMRIFSEDWVCFRKLLVSEMKSYTTFSNNYVDIYYYACRHGMIMPLASVDLFLQKYINIMDGSILLGQLHFGCVFTTLVEKSKIVFDFDKLHSVFCMNKSSITYYRPYFFGSYGYFSVVTKNFNFPSVQYIQGYRTAAHMLMKKQCKQNAMFLRLFINQSLDHVPEKFRGYISPLKENGEIKLEIFRGFIDSIITTPDCRLEFVCELNLLSSNLLSETELKIKLDGFISKFISFEAIVEVNGFKDWVEETINPIINPFVVAIKEKKVLSTDEITKLYYFENILNFWCNGSTLGVNGDALKMILRGKTISKSIGKVGLLEVNFHKIHNFSMGKIKSPPIEGITGLPHPQIKNYIKLIFSYFQRKGLNGSAEEKLLGLYAQYVAELHLHICTIKNKFEPEVVFSLNHQYDHKRQHIPPQKLLHSDVVKIMLSPTRIVGGLFLGVVGNIDEAKLLKIVKKSIFTFPKSLMVVGSNSTKWVVVTDKVRDVLQAFDRGNLSGSIVKQCNLKQYSRKSVLPAVKNSADDSINQTLSEDFNLPSYSTDMAKAVFDFLLLPGNIERKKDLQFIRQLYNSNRILKDKSPSNLLIFIKSIKRNSIEELSQFCSIFNAHEIKSMVV